MTTRLSGFVLRRLAGAVLFVVVVSASALMLVRFAPGDAATDLAMTVADASAAADTRTRLGLDRPAWRQMAEWLGGLAQMELGQSSRFGRPVAGLVGERLLNTAVLAGTALMLATLIGVPLGVFTGTRSRHPGARVAAACTVFFIAIPPIIGTLGLLYLATTTGWLSTAPGSLALPTLALALPTAAAIERLQSQAASEALGLPSVLAAAARGVPRRRLIWIHAVRPALQPVLGVYGIVIATLFSGSVAVETMTAWPGLGRLMLEGLLARDLFLVAGCALVGALMIAMGNLIADVLRAIADPRVCEGA